MISKCVEYFEITKYAHYTEIKKFYPFMFKFRKMLQVKKSDIKFKPITSIILFDVAFSTILKILTHTNEMHTRETQISKPYFLHKYII